MNIITTIGRMDTDIVNEPNNTNDEMCNSIVAKNMLKLVHDHKMEKASCQEEA